MLGDTFIGDFVVPKVALLGFVWVVAVVAVVVVKGLLGDLRVADLTGDTFDTPLTTLAAPADVVVVVGTLPVFGAGFLSGDLAVGGAIESTI